MECSLLSTICNYYYSPLDPPHLHPPPFSSTSSSSSSLLLLFLLLLNNFMQTSILIYYSQIFSDSLPRHKFKFANPKWPPQFFLGVNTSEEKIDCYVDSLAINSPT